MRLLRLFLAVFGTLALALELAAPAAPRTESARFAVSTHGTLVEQWTYTRAVTLNGCPATIKGAGKRTISLRTPDVPVVSGSWSGGTARARFGGALRLSGSITQTGKRTTVVGKGQGCEPATHTVACDPVNRTFSGARATVVSRRRHRLGIAAAAGLVPAEFFGSCPGEPTKVRAIGNGIELGDATYKEATLFSRNTAGLTLQGSADVTTTLGGDAGTVVQHVRMTLVLRHVGA